MRRFLTGLVLTLSVLPATVFAQWVLDGTSLTAVPQNQVSPAIVSDGTGGAIIAWQDGRNGNNDVYAQRVNGSGTPLWALNGVAVCTAAGEQWTPALLADGAGGVFIVWEDDRSGSGDVYAQRLNSAGVPYWAANGVALCTAADSQEFPVLASDGSGGIVAAWPDRRSGTNYDIYAQRVNSSGVAQWVGNGVVVCVDGTDQDSPQITANGAGSTILVWRDWRFGISDSDIYGQRLTSGGAVQWGASGINVCGALGNQQAPQLVADAAAGAVIAWADLRNGGNFDIYAQRMNSSGSALWIGNGVALCTAAIDQRWPVMVSDGAGGAVVVWYDSRAFDNDLYGQRVSASGSAVWTGNGVPVCTTPGSQTNPFIVPDGTGGYIVSWSDSRNGATIDFSNVFAQRFSNAGAPLWTQDGISVSSAADYQGMPACISDGTGGSILAWEDSRSSLSDIYAQRIDNTYGFWGRPEPTVTAVKDIPHDQGGKVAVNWTASGRDNAFPRTIQFYSIWRAVDAVPMGATTITSDELRDLAPDDAGPVYLSTPSRYYERVGTQDAQGWLGYSFSADTRADSVASATGNEYFMVAAHFIADYFISFASNEVSGHSVDNLAPAAPLLLTAQRIGNYVYLKWNGVHVSDLRDYAVYRKTASGVTPVPINFLATSDDTLLTDTTAPTGALYYIVTALDAHANQSAPSNEASVQATTGIGDTPALTALTVLQNHPNPFTATTDFEVGLPRNSDVRIDIFDVAGRRVSAIDVKGAKAGWQRIAFAGRDDRDRPLASGVYFYRVNAAGATSTKKMVIAR